MHRINEEIQLKEVRVNGILYPIKDALELAGDLDLVEISPGICKILNYEKFLYELKKNKNNKKIELKEIRFTQDIAENDISHKLNQAKEFIQKGHKVKLTVTFSGRNIIYKDRGEEVLNKFKDSLKEISKVEKDISLEGKRMSLILTKK